MPKTIEQHNFPNTEIQTEAANYIARHLEQVLAQHSVFLLLSGGSAIKMYKQVFEQLAQSSSPRHKLFVSMFDERFVPKNSPDSNETQLQEANVLELLKKLRATWIPYLPDKPTTGDEIAKQMSDRFIKIIERTGYMLVLAGIGSDGHTAGILPTKDGETIKHIYGSAELIEYYELPDDVDNPHRQRLTATPSFITLVDQVIVYAVGQDKQAALKDFAANEKSAIELPSISLHKSQSPVIVLTDQTV